MMKARKAPKDNDLFFTCCLIDYIARKTLNTRVDIVNYMGKKDWKKYTDWQTFIIVITLTG